MLAKKTIKGRPPLIRLWLQISPYRRKQLVSLVLIMLAASVAEVVSIGAVLPFLGVLLEPERVFALPIIQQFVTIVGLSEPPQLLKLLTGFFIFAALCAGGVRLCLLWVQTRLAYAIGSDLSFQIYKKNLYQPYSVHVARNSSEVITGISSKTDSVIGATLLPLLNITSSFIILVSVLAILIAVNSHLAILSVLCFGTIYGVIIFITKRRLAIDSESISRKSTLVIKALQEGLGGIRDILIDGVQEAYCRVYRNADVPMRQSQASIVIISGSPRYIIECIGISLIAGLAYFLAVHGEGIASAVPLLGTLAVGAQRLLPLLQQIYGSWSSIQGGQASLRDVLDQLEQPFANSIDKFSLAPIPFKRSICLNKISYRYDKNDQEVLHNINIEMSKGSRIGFVGTTGSGKSTLLDIIMGLLEPTEGEITVDGELITYSNNRNWQAHIAHVPQTIFFADATIAENIAFGVPLDQIDYDLIYKVAEQAQISSTINNLQNGYLTHVGERGVRLSGGQRQRIGVARALYKQVDVLIFDEATSALDVKTERELIKAINQFSPNITILMVAHRLSTLGCCDLIVELENGSISNIGSYSETIGAMKDKLN
jgi:ATP-binding cassette subfamily B protein